jgi:hypothetical protein
MINSEPIIEINREGKTLSVKAIIQTWNKFEGGHICIHIPFLGGLITHAENEQDAEKAVEEAFHCFVIISEKHGMGVENELSFIGWNKESGESKNHSIFTIDNLNSAMESMMETGDTRVLEVAL